MKAGVPITVEVDQADAMGVGLSLVTLAKSRAMPDETRQVYDRVGRQMIASAKAGPK